MQDTELKKLLQEPCPIRPGQEERAWATLQTRLFSASPTRSGWEWLYYPTWRGLVAACLAIALIPVIGNVVFMRDGPLSFTSADSQAPGIYATAFYSNSAKAQVVWLNGMGPATDAPTYLDPTTVIASSPESPQPAGDPNSL